MTARRSLIFVALALLAITAAMLVASRRGETPHADSALLYPDFKTQAKNVKAIHVFKTGDVPAVEMLSDGDRWTLTQRNGYPVSPEQVQDLVRALANAKLLEEKTSDPSKYAALSVEDVTSPDAQGVRVALDGPATPVNLIVGKPGADAKSSFVRRVGESKSWLIDERLTVSSEPRDWLDKQIIHVLPDRVQAVTISANGAKPYTISKTSRADANFKVDQLPKGKTLRGEGMPNGIALALLSLSLDDVLPKTNLLTSKPAAQATYKTFDGLIVSIDGFEQNQKHYITLTTTYDQTLADRFKRPTTDTSSKTDGAATKSEVAAEAQTSAAKLAGWTYEIADHKYRAIFRPLDDLLNQ